MVQSATNMEFTLNILKLEDTYANFLNTVERVRRLREKLTNAPKIILLLATDTPDCILTVF